MEATLLLHGVGGTDGRGAGGWKAATLARGRGEVLVVYPLALQRCNRAIADDKDRSKNSMKFPVTSLFENDSRGTVSGTRLWV